MSKTKTLSTPNTIQSISSAMVNATVLTAEINEIRFEMGFREKHNRPLHASQTDRELRNILTDKRAELNSVLAEYERLAGQWIDMIQKHC